MEKKRTQVPQKSAKVDILPISIYLVVVLYRHKHCRPQKVELDLACRDSTTTKTDICCHRISIYIFLNYLQFFWIFFAVFCSLFKEYFR
jgi:hypothetical protein